MEGLPIDLEARLNWLDKAIQECDAERERLGRERLILHGRLLEAQYLYEQSRRAPQPAPQETGPTLQQTPEKNIVSMEEMRGKAQASETTAP